MSSNTSYLDETKAIVDFYKPRMEEKTGVKLKDIVIGTRSEAYLNALSDSKETVAENVSPVLQDIVFNFVARPLLFAEYKWGSRPIESYLGVFYLGKSMKELLTHKLGDAHFEVVFALAWLTELEINPTINNHSRSFQEFVIKEALRGGFPDYVSLDLMADSYVPGMQNNLDWRRDYLIAEAKSKIATGRFLGYSFVSSVAQYAGTTAVFDLIKNPDVLHDELRAPSKYISRKGLEPAMESLDISA